MYHDGYLVMDLLLGIVWLFLFLKRKDLRIEMLLMSALITSTLVITGIVYLNHYITDYWRPEYAGLLKLGPLFQSLGLKIGGTEDAFFVFFFSGIGAVIYEELLGKKHLKKSRKKSLKVFLIFPLVLFLSWSAVLLSDKLNIIYGDFIGYFISTLIVWYYRKDLIKHSLLSGLFLGTFFFLFYYLIYVRIYPGIFHAWWILHKASGVFLLGIPLEEILWAFFIGLWVGPLYEYMVGLKDGK